MNKSIEEKQFQKGDWVVRHSSHKTALLADEVYQVYDIDDNGYYMINSHGQIPHFGFDAVKWDFRLWTLDDIKDGDVLIHENMHDPFIAKYYDKQNNQIICHCGLSTMDYNFNEKPYTETELNVIPAEFKRKQNFYDHMRKTGYYWDFKNNKLLHYGKWMYVRMDTMYEWFYKVKELSFLNREQLLTDFITFIKEKSGENII